LTLELEQQNTEALEQLMEDFGAVSISFSDAADEPLLEPKPGETPLWLHISAVVLFSIDAPQQSILSALAEQFPAEAITAAITLLEDREWLNEWKRDASPKKYGTRLWVYPWQPKIDDAKEKVIVELEPGLAFGTGEHPTTRMCLQWLDNNDLRQKSIVDYGCGSGLLAIAALKLDAAFATAVDIDNQAITATLSNAKQNNVEERLEAITTEVKIERSYNIVMANILSGILIELSSVLSNLVEPSGSLVLTGILANQAAAVQNAYAKNFDLSISDQQDEWVLLTGCRLVDNG
jgi:ribosomal protein L11 methyltransferase